MIPPQNRKHWAAGLTVGHVLAICSTIYRFCHRYRMRRVWWDDWFAILCLVCDVPFFAVLWMRSTIDESATKEYQVVLYYMSGIGFMCVVWLARISLAFSLARIFPPNVNWYNFSVRLAGGCGLALTSLVLQILISCNIDTSWHNTVNVQCRVGGNAWASVLVMDLIADFTLIATPLFVLWRVKLPKNPRRLILSVFAASIFSSLVTIALHTFLFGPKSWGPWREVLVFWMAQLEAIVCVLVCNLLVVVTVYYRVFGNGEDIEETYLTNPSEVERHRTTSPSRPGEVTLTSLTESMFSDLDSIFTDPTASGSTQPSNPAKVDPHLVLSA